MNVKSFNFIFLFLLIFQTSSQAHLFTSESVTKGHPDKLCDTISDAILDAILSKDPEARVACETFATTGLVLVGGEITTNCYIDIQAVVRNTIKEIGYTNPEYGFHYENCSVLTTIHEQSPDIAMGVDETKDHESGAGDQGLMFGYACNETEELMPLPIHLAHKLAERLTQVREEKILPWVRPDGKTQVTIEYENEKPKFIDTIVISTQHDPDISQEKIKSEIIKFVINPICEKYLTEKTKYFINPTGRFVKGGPHADTGLTGRKIIVDTYGGMGRHGGGAFSGKDPSKVDRSASYMARHIAKNIVAAKLADRCEVQLAYAIGIAEPVSIFINTFGTSKIDEKKIENAVKKIFPLKPKALIEYLDLKRPIYQETASYGHFGRNIKNFTWEKTNKIEELQNSLL